jgi:hypothetical protein
MERTKVYKLIDTERTYQDTVRRQNEKDAREDHEKSIADFLLYIEFTLKKAKKSVYELNEREAMSYVRKIAGLSVAAMESFETPERKLL